MRYVMGDVHGDIKHLEMMLQTINFNPKRDHMYFLGDVVDRGPEVISTLKRVSEMVTDGCATLLLGNHEYFIMLYMEGVLSAPKWKNFGAGDLKEYIDQMSKEERKKLYDFLDSLPVYVEIESPCLGKTVLVHAGFYENDNAIVRSNDGTIKVIETIDRQLSHGYFDVLVTGDLHDMALSKDFKTDHHIICGHVPTYRLGNEAPFEAYITPFYMDLDTGNGYRETRQGRLCCYCVDTDSYYYE